MKKKNKIISSIIVIIVALLGYWLLNRPVALGSMNLSFAEPTTAKSTFTFLGDEGDRIKFTFKSNVKSGNLDIRLYDSKGNMVFELYHGGDLQWPFDLAYTDTYTVVAEYSDFVGFFKLKVTT